MSIAPLQLPGAFQSPTLDLAGGLSQLGQIYKQRQAEELQKQVLATADPDAMIRSGDLSLAQIGATMKNRLEDQAFKQQEAARQASQFQQTYELQKRASARADEGPIETAAQRAQAARANGVDPTTPAGKSYILTGKLPEADTTFQASVEQRKQAAVANGLAPDSPGFQSFVLTGKMPREDAQPLTAGDKEAIRTADEAVLSNRSAIESLNRAKDLSKKAFSGPAASGRGYAASFLGESSDIGKGGIATENLTNEVMTNALGQLKNIFGGNPTEGERKIMLEMQGSVSKPDTVRQEIYNRAINLAQKKLEFNQKRADDLRGGTYYKQPGAAKVTDVATGPTTQIPPAAIEALKANPALKAAFEAKYGPGTAGVVIR